MKKILTIIASFFFTSALYANTNLTFETKKISETNQQPKYQITVTYPQIENPKSPAEIKFNDTAKKWVLNRITQFKKSIKEWDTSKLPSSVTANGSSLTINYDLNNSEPQVIISVRYNADNYFAGAAHPTHTYSSINYDLNHNKELLLPDLFQSNTNFLQKITLISTKKVTEKLNTAANGKADIFKDGLAPNLKNYSVWNITPKGIKFTFNEYQVAAYVFGAQEIVIPYKQLSPLFASNSTLAKCLADSSCQINIQVDQM